MYVWFRASQGTKYVPLKFQLVAQNETSQRITTWFRKQLELYVLNKKHDCSIIHIHLDGHFPQCVS